MPAPDSEPLSFSRFCQDLLSAIDVSHREVREDTKIFDDLELDSLEAFELIHVAEEMAGYRASGADLLVDEAGPVLFTLGDLYAYYCDVLAHMPPMGA